VRETWIGVSLLLAGKHMGLIHSIATVAKKPLVLVLAWGGGPVDVSFAKQYSRFTNREHSLALIYLYH
jgi:hypothetical protein